MASPVSQNGSHSIGELIAEHWFDPGNFTKTHFIMVAVAFVLACCIIKIIYSFRDFGINYVLEPISVFAIGLLFGKMANEFNLELTYFDEMTFFVLLLPPIIFEAVLHMHKSYFLQHITAILLFGFLGTLLNFALIGVSLVFVDDYFGVFKSEGLQITTLGYFLFSCLGSSVDSVIVLGILGEMRVHPSLYFIFVGESVINDGVTLAVFDYVYKVICHPSIHVSETTLEIILVGIFIVSAKIVIASMTGVVFGVFACIITRFTGHASAIEPLVVISGSYLTYLLNYSLHWPGVFSILLFWLIQSAYTFQNITPKSRMTIKRFARMTASISESLIFLTMGYTLVVHDFEWHTNFKLISLFLSILWRFIIVFILSVFVNKLHSLQNNLSKTTIFVLGFCGLRGAISHGLTEIVTQECLNNVGIDVNMLRSTSAFLTVFTIIIIGTLMKPLLHLLQMKQENKPTSLFQTLNQQVIWKMCACVDDILGTKEWGRRSSCVPKLERFARHLLLRDPIGRDDILEAFTKITLALHNAGIATTKNKADHYLSKVYPSLKPLYLQNQQTMRGGGIPSEVYSSTMSLDKRKPYHPHFHYQPILTKSMLNIHRLLTGKKISPEDLKSVPKKIERKSTFKSWGSTNDYQQPPTVKQSNDVMITFKKQSSRAFSSETLLSENINVLSTERSFSEEYLSALSKENQSKGNWRERLKKFVTFTGLESNKVDPETEDVNTMLFLSRQYHTADSVTYLDKLKHAMQLKQNAIRLQNYKGPLLRLYSGRSFDRMAMSPMHEGAMNPPNTTATTTTTFTKRVTHKPKLPTNFILKTEDETKVEKKAETNMEHS